MRRILRRLAVTMLLIGIGLSPLSCDQSNSANANENQNVLGSWKIVRAEFAGTPLDQLKGAKLVFAKEGKKQLVLGPKQVEDGTYKLIKSDPLGMDTTTVGKSERPKGIYRIKDGQLELVFAQQGGARPTTFSSQAGSDHIQLVLRRDGKPPATTSTPKKVAVQPMPSSRCFRMGITGFPHDMTAEAAIATQKFSQNNGDIIAHHIEGVPWTAMHRGEAFPKPFADAMNGKKSMTPPGGKVYLAISPGRGELKPHDKAPKIPSALRGKQYSDPLVKQAYLRYCQKMIEFFDPDYLAIGIEVNEIWGVIFKREWKASLDLHKYVYQQLKRDHPELPIFASMTLHTLHNKQGGMVDGMSDLMPYCDLVGISYYPFFVEDKSRLKTFDWLFKEFDRYDKPYAMVETNAAAETTKFDSYTVAGTPQRQLEYYQHLFDAAQEHEFVFVIAFIHRDYDPLWEKIKGSSPQLFKAWMNCGFLDENGTPRPSYQLWENYFAAEFDPREF